MVSAYQIETWEVVRFSAGSRSNKTLNRVSHSSRLSNAKKIYTDKLKNYRYLIEKKVHSTKQYANNHLEWMHLNYCTHLKRLNRRSICFSPLLLMLVCILKIYFWGWIGFCNIKVPNLILSHEKNLLLHFAALYSSEFVESKFSSRKTTLQFRRETFKP